MKIDCKRCIWYDDCDEHNVCYGYFDGTMRDDIDSYKKNLKLRAEAYEEVIKDFRS